MKAQGKVNEARLKIGLDPAAAAKLLDEASAMAPKNPEAYFLRAQAKANLKDYAGGLADLDKTLALNPGDKAALRERIAVENVLGRQRDRIMANYLAAGGREPEFSADYAEFAAKHLQGEGGGTPGGREQSQGARAGSSASSRRGGWAEWPQRLKDQAPLLVLAGLALIVFVGAFRLLRRPRQEPPEDGD